MYTEALNSISQSINHMMDSSQLFSNTMFPVCAVYYASMRAAVTMIQAKTCPST